MLKVIVFILFGALILSIFLKKYEKRIFWLSLILILLLPVKECFQIFLGVPIRLFSADVLECIFKILNIDSISQSSILIFESNITNIDYPCSGVLTIYYTLFFIFIISFILNLSLNFSLILKIFFCNFFIVFLNIFRIFVLILLNLQGLTFFSDKIHIILGLINYIAACFLFLYLAKNEKNRENKNIISRVFLFVIFIVLSSLLYFRLKMPESDSRFEIIRNENHKNLDFSSKEISYYQKNGAKIEKYKEDNDIVIKIYSQSPFVFHNPLICFKNQDIKIFESKTIKYKNGFARKLKTNKGVIYYYFLDDKKITDDYYKIAFLSLIDKKERVLVIQMH